MITLKDKVKQKRAIGIVGTIARATVGLGLILYIAGDLELYQVLLGLVVFPAMFILWQRLRLRRTQEPLRATGLADLVVSIVAITILIVIPFTSNATVLFFAASMLVAAIRGYAGCQVTAITNWLLKRNDQVGCIVFSPIDALEKRLTGK